CKPPLDSISPGTSRSEKLSAATTVATTTSGAAIAIAPSAAASSRTPAARTFLARTGDINFEGLVMEVRAVECLLRGLGRLISGHSHEGKAPRLARGSVNDQVHIVHRAVRREEVLKIVFSDVSGEVSDKQFVLHFDS